MSIIYDHLLMKKTIWLQKGVFLLVHH